jgi:transmembrane sensor
LNEETDIQRLLKAAGPRERVPPDVIAAAREELRGEWRRIVAERRAGRRRATAFAIAAGVAAVAVGSWMVARQASEPGAAVGTVVVAQDDVRLRGGWLAGWDRAVAGSPVSAGDTIETGPAGRAGMSLPGGVSARLDGGTRIRLASGERIVIERGTLYVDAGAALGRESALRVDTPTGVVRHLGTQYEVRVEGDAVRLRIREGRVELQSRSGALEQASAGEQLMIAANGDVTRSHAPRYGASWGWVESVAPAIDVDGRPLAEFLAWAARELGAEVTYMSEATREEAESVVVHGSIEGLTPRQALDTVLATTTLEGSFDDGELRISGGMPE